MFKQLIPDSVVFAGQIVTFEDKTYEVVTVRAIQEMSAIGDKPDMTIIYDLSEIDEDGDYVGNATIKGVPYDMCTEV